MSKPYRVEVKDSSLKKESKIPKSGNIMEILFIIHSFFINYIKGESDKERLHRVIKNLLPLIDGFQFCTEDKLTELQNFLTSNKLAEQFKEYSYIISLKHHLNGCKKTHKLIIFEEDRYKNYEELYNLYENLIKEYNDKYFAKKNVSDQEDNQVCSCKDFTIEFLSLLFITEYTQNKNDTTTKLDIINHIIEIITSHIQVVCNCSNNDELINQLSSEETITKVLSCSHNICERKGIEIYRYCEY